MTLHNNERREGRVHFAPGGMKLGGKEVGYGVPGDIKSCTRSEINGLICLTRHGVIFQLGLLAVIVFPSGSGYRIATQWYGVGCNGVYDILSSMVCTRQAITSIAPVGS